MLSQVRAEDVLRPILPSEPASVTRFRRRAGVGFGVEKRGEDRAHVVRVIAPDVLGDRINECEVDEELIPTVLWIAATSLGRTFSPSDAPRDPSVSDEDIAELCLTLMDAGGIAPA